MVDVGNQGHMPADCDEEGCPDCIPVVPEDEDPTAGFMIPQDR